MSSIKRTLTVVLLIFCGLLISNSSYAQNAEYVEGELIVKFSENASQSEIGNIRANFNAQSKRSYRLINAEVWKIGKDDPGSIIDALKQLEYVEYAEPNYILRMVETIPQELDAVPGDPRLEDLWGMHNEGQLGGTVDADIDALEAWGVTTGSHDVIIGVIDSGVDYLHEDLVGNIWTNEGEIPGNGIDDDLNGYVDDVHGYDFVNNDGDPMDDNDHGTHCSGTIAGVGDNGIGVVGVNWQAQIMALKFLSAGGSGTTDAAIAAVEYATMMGAHLTSNSWGGGGYSQALYDAIEAAGEAGQLFIAAAGNDGIDNDSYPHYPSSYDLDNIISVASTDDNDYMSGFSNYGLTSVDLGAPGSSILSTIPNDYYSFFSGTSMATPHVAGVAGLIISQDPALGLESISYQTVRDRILNSVDPIPALDGKTVTGGRLNAFMAVAIPDSISPSPITDATTLDISSSTISLQWTASGDDDLEGTAAFYDIRYANVPITEDNFYGALEVEHNLLPSEAGSTEYLVVDGLTFDTQYYFAIKVVDEWGNTSLISNSPSGTTLGQPVLAFTPDSLYQELFTGQSNDQTITFSNTGEGTLDFSFPAFNAMELLSDPEIEKNNVANNFSYAVPKKGVLDAREGNPVVLGAGGPDEFGYTWIDSDEIGGPVFDWNDISEVGSQVNLSDDDYEQVNISFDFPFYGNEYNSIFISSNGILTFGKGVYDFGNRPIPNASEPNNFIAAIWDDLYPPNGGAIYYYNDESTNQFVVQFDEIYHINGSGYYTFQVILSANGAIQIKYLEVTGTLLGATVGIENEDGNDGLQMAFNTNYIHDNLAINIATIPEWITGVSPASGRVATGEELDVAVTYDASKMGSGSYFTYLNFTTNDPDNEIVDMPSYLDVIGVQDIVLYDDVLDFGEQFVADTAFLSLRVYNEGTDELILNDVSLTGNNFEIVSFDSAIGINAFTEILVQYSTVVESSDSEVLTIQSNDPDEPTVTVDLFGQSILPPIISVVPSELSANLLTGQTDTQIITIDNTEGGSDLIWDIDIYSIEENIFAKNHSRGSIIGESYLVRDNQKNPTPSLFSLSDTLLTFDTGTEGLILGGDMVWNEIGGGHLLNDGYNDDDYLYFPEPTDVISFEMNSQPWEGYNGPTGILDINAYNINEELIWSATVDLTEYLDWDEWFTVEVNTSDVYYFEFVAPGGPPHNNGFWPSIDNLWLGKNQGAEFLTLDIDSGRVTAGSSQDVSITFDASGLETGTYQRIVGIANNDPVSPLVEIDATMDVTGVQDIEVSKDSLFYPTIFVGDSLSDVFVVANMGTDTLKISSFASNSEVFSTTATSTSLKPGESLEVWVKYLPVESGFQQATLSIFSDDPDENVVFVQLEGTSLLPPIVAITPDSLYSALLSGQTDTQTLTISNEGGEGTLEFQIDNLPLTEAFNQFQVAKTDQEETSKNSSSDNPVSTIVADSLNGEEAVLVIQDTDAWGLILEEFIEANFAVEAVTIPYTMITSEDFNDYEIVMTVGDESTYYYDAISSNKELFEEYLSNGGTVIYQLATQGSNVELAGDVSIIYQDAENYNTVVASDHPIVADLPELLEGNSANHTYVSNLPDDAIIITETTEQGNPTTVEYSFGRGTVIATGMTWEFLYTRGFNSEMLQYNAVAYALGISGKPVGQYISANILSGTIEAGESMDIAITFDATGLYTESYLTDIVFLTNDPENSEFVIPTHLDVTGVQDISISDDSLFYPLTFTGDTTYNFLTISNEGTENLEVTSIESENDAYQADFIPTTLAPGDELDVVIAYIPIEPGDDAAILTITSDDPDEENIYVSLEASAIDPPIITVTPEYISSRLISGQTETRKLSISNADGGSDLDFDIVVRNSSFEEYNQFGQKITTMMNQNEIKHSYRSSKGQQLSIGQAPKNLVAKAAANVEDFIQLGEIGIQAYGAETQMTGMVRFDLGLPDSLDYLMNIPSNAFPGAGTLDGKNPNIAYHIESSDLYRVDLTANTFTHIADLQTEEMSGMTYDPFTQMYYGVSTTIDNSWLYKIDVEHGTADLIGELEGVAGAIALSIAGDGNLYTYDIVTDYLYVLNKETAENYQIGYIGFNANFGQGMSYDSESDILYMTAFNSDTFLPELRAVDTETGNTTLIGVLGSTYPGDIVQVAWLGTKVASIPSFLSLSETSGVIPAGETMEIDVILGTINEEVEVETSDLEPGVYQAELQIGTNDPLNPSLSVDIVLSVLQSGSVNIYLSENWNLISFHVQPEDSSTESIVTDILDNIRVIQGFDGTGLTFDPSLDTDFNTLNEMYSTQGYWLKMLNEDVLEIDGYVQVANTPIDMSEGFNLVGYLPTRMDSLKHAFSGIMDQIEVVLGFENGGVAYSPYIPEEFNTLQVLKPGYGYWVKLKEATTLVYPDTSVVIDEVEVQILADLSLKAKSKNGVSNSSIKLNPSREWITIWSDGLQIAGENIPEGTEIKVTDSNGTLAGYTTLKMPGKLQMMSVYRDDPATEIDEGADRGELLDLHIGDIVISEAIEWTSNGAIIDKSKSISAILEDFEALPTEFALNQNYPNPFNPSTNIVYSLPQQSKVTLEVFTLLGQKVATLVNNNIQDAGNYSIQFNANGLSSGMYIYRLQAGNFVQIKKMLLIK